jgi:hypothetical protein
MGRWHGATFKEYVRNELACFSSGMSRDMKTKFGFVNVSGNAFSDITDACIIADYFAPSTVAVMKELITSVLSARHPLVFPMPTVHYNDATARWLTRIGSSRTTVLGMGLRYHYLSLSLSPTYDIGDVFYLTVWMSSDLYLFYISSIGRHC